MRFLVDSSPSLGDIAIDVALLRAIARNGHQLEVLAGAANADVLIDCDFIGRVHRKDRAWHRKIASCWRATRCRWDAIIVPRMFSGRLNLINLFGRADHLRDRRHMDSSLYDQGAVVYRLSILDGLIDDWRDPIETGIPYGNERLRQAQQAAGLAAGDPYMTVAPGSAGVAKRWPVESFAQALQQLGTRFPQIAVIGAPDERGLCEQLAQSCEGAVSVAGRIDLAASCALVSNAAFHLGNDSGLGHVAAGNGVPTLAVGGQGSHYVPWHQHMLAGLPGRITVGQVIDRIVGIIDPLGDLAP